jgi:hypothetical protein
MPAIREQLSQRANMAAQTAKPSACVMPTALLSSPKRAPSMQYRTHQSAFVAPAKPTRRDAIDAVIPLTTKIADGDSAIVMDNADSSLNRRMIVPSPRDLGQAAAR